MSKEICEGLDERVRALLKENKMTLKKLCETTGIAKSTMVSSLDRLTLSSTNAIKIAGALGVTLDYLLKGIESEEKAPSTLCTRFHCPADPFNQLCCHFCESRNTCEEACLNHPDKCGLLKE